MSKKSPTAKRPGAVAVVARVARGLHYLGFGMMAVLPVLLVSTWLDPERPARQERESAARQARQARQEQRILAQAGAEPATGRLNLSFAKLDFQLPAGTRPDYGPAGGLAGYLPSGIKLYHGRDVRIEGYMLPTKMERGLVKECLVLASPMACCFGQAPRFCEFMAVRFAAPVPSVMDEPVRFEGKFRVGDVFADGAWVALYSLEDASAVSSLNRVAWK